MLNVMRSNGLRRLSLSIALGLSVVSLSPLASAADDGKDAAIFRNIFYSYAKSQYSDAEIQRLIFQPKSDFFKATSIEGEAADALKKRGEDWSVFLPSDLYKDGIAAPAGDAGDLNEALDQKPITIVIIPGIFGEFIDHFPFHEVVSNKDRAFAKEWAKAIADHPTEDEVFDLETLAPVKHSMSDIIEASSVDDAKGKAVVRLIYLKPLLGSLETLGTLEDSSTIYLRRLNKLWSILGPQENLYLLGYSRGMNVALDLVNRAEAKPDDYPWLGKIKGVVSLGGTIYGSAIADAAFTEGQVSCQAIQRMVKLADDLTVLPKDANLADKIKVVASNSAAWAKAGIDLLGIGASMPKSEGLEIESITTDSPNLGVFGETLKTVAFDTFKIDQGAEYSNNVEKFKYLIREAVEGIDTLTARQGLAWIKGHTVSTRMKYFVIQGLMGDPSSKKDGRGALAEDSVSFNTRTLDYKVLRRSYYDYLAFQGMQLNDSQVSPDRSIFWPELHKKLNPAQEDFEAHLLTIIGTDHWGMSFPVALVSENDETSPFPREILVKTLGAFLAQDLFNKP
ncbi:MAG: hypothetical protein H7318_07015 [Oligoflexus sp.]|nr:hypothetical protein [Oligoflexus sp.]